MTRRIFVDIGGTYIRFAKETDSRLQEIEKFLIADFPSLDDALTSYANKDDDIYIASTGRLNDENIWHITNGSKWQIKPQSKTATGFNIARILNDFEASAASLRDLDGSHLQSIYEPSKLKANNNYALVGAGTGLGLAYNMRETNRFCVRPCPSGGHMVAASVTDEQFEILQKISAFNDRQAIFEDVASGNGLFHLYRAVTGNQTQDAEIAVANANVLRLFHEFMGLFVHQAIIYGDSFGGVYLTGGVIDRLMEKDLFDAASLLRYIHIKGVPIMNDSLEGTPIYYVADPYLGLRGLNALFSTGS